MESQTGLIGFFDILGYQNLLENNKPESVAKKVIKLLSNLDKEIISSMKTDCKSIFDKYISSPAQMDTDELMSNVFDGFRWLIFSDTILLSMPLKKINYNDLKVIVFVMACRRLLEKMFDEGLPLRGAIDFGDYYIKENCFAGKAIIESYKLSNFIDLSGCVLSSKCRDRFLEQDNSGFLKLVYDESFVEYLIPTKAGEKTYLSLIHMPKSIKNTDDIKKAVLTSFWAHNKTIPKEVMHKVKYTEQWFHFLKIKKKS